MSHDPALRPCAHPGCTRWALYNDAACVVHAGQVQAAVRPAVSWPASAMPLDPPPAPNPAQQLALVIAHRDSLDRFIRLGVGYRSKPLTDELDYLRALSRLATDLAAALARPSDTAAADEIDRFLDEVAREARESPHWHSDDPYGLGVQTRRLQPAGRGVP